MKAQTTFRGVRDLGDLKAARPLAVQGCLAGAVLTVVARSGDRVIWALMAVTLLGYGMLVAGAVCGHRLRILDDRLVISRWLRRTDIIHFARVDQLSTERLIFGRHRCWTIAAIIAGDRHVLAVSCTEGDSPDEKTRLLAESLESAIEAFRNRLRGP